MADVKGNRGKSAEGGVETPLGAWQENYAMRSLISQSSNGHHIRPWLNIPWKPPYRAPCLRRKPMTVAVGFKCSDGFVLRLGIAES